MTQFTKEIIISVDELSKAIDSLQISINLLNTSLNEQSNHLELHKALRDSCIQRFEFCVELSWKVSIKILGLAIKAPNTAIRDMAQNNLIDNPDSWFDYLVARNKTSHTYAEDIARQVYQTTLSALPDFIKLLNNLKDRIK